MLETPRLLTKINGEGYIDVVSRASGITVTLTDNDDEMHLSLIADVS